MIYPGDVVYEKNGLRVVAVADPYADYSYLQQPGWEDRFTSYEQGDFDFIGLVLQEHCPSCDTWQDTMHSLWSIENDAERDDYLDIAQDLVSEYEPPQEASNDMSQQNAIPCPEVTYKDVEQIACIDWQDAYEDWLKELDLPDGPITITPTRMKSFLEFSWVEHGLEPYQAIYAIVSNWIRDAALENAFRLLVQEGGMDRDRALDEEGPMTGRIEHLVESLFALASVRGWRSDKVASKLWWPEASDTSKDRGRTFATEPLDDDAPEPTETHGLAWMRNSLGEITIIHPEYGLRTVPNDHPRLDDITSALRSAHYQRALELADQQEAVRRFLDIRHDGIVLRTGRGGELLLNDAPLPDVVAQKAMDLIELDMDAGPLLRFLSRSAANPTPGIHEQLLSFIVANDFQIDSEGHIVAWKKVSEDLKDLWTKELDYSPPRTVTMPKDAVVQDPDQACAPGLHFATWRFTYNYSGPRRVVELRVDPKHVVSVPRAHTDKARAHTFYIIREVTGWRSLDQNTPPSAPPGGIWPSVDLTKAETTFSTK